MSLVRGSGCDWSDVIACELSDQSDHHAKRRDREKSFRQLESSLRRLGGWTFNFTIEVGIGFPNAWDDRPVIVRSDVRYTRSAEEIF